MGLVLNGCNFPCIFGAEGLETMVPCLIPCPDKPKIPCKDAEAFCQQLSNARLPVVLWTWHGQKEVGGGVLVVLGWF